LTENGEGEGIGENKGGRLEECRETGTAREKYYLFVNSIIPNINVLHRIVTT